MPDADIDALSELRFVPKFLETAIEDAVLEINSREGRSAWEAELVRQWERYVRWRAHTTQNPALLGNIAQEIEGALAKLRSASALMAGKGPLLAKNAVAEGFEGR